MPDKDTPQVRGGFTPIASIDIEAPAWLRRISWPAVLVGLIGLLPVAASVVEVLRSPRLHFIDYWTVLSRLTNDDGTLIPRALLGYHHEHPMFVPQFLFWLDARFLGGSNHTLGLLALVLAGGLVVVLNRMLPRELGVLTRTALTVGFVFLVFSTTATELFGQGMSGISWFPVLLSSALALLCAQRGRPWLSFGFGVLACVCHATGFGVWPAIALIAWLRGDKARRVVWPLVVGAAVVAVWAVTVTRERISAGRLDADDYLATVASTVGQLWSARVEDLAVGMGAFTAAGVLALTVALIRDRGLGRSVSPAAAGFSGLGIFVLAGAAMVAYSRTQFGVGVGMSGRYAAFAALATAALVVLIVLRRSRIPANTVVAGVLVLSAVTWVLGNGQAGIQRRLYPNQEVAAVALRVNATAQLARLRVKPEVRPAALALGVYPFNSDFSLGCGAGRELGDKVDLSTVKDLAQPGDPGPNTGHVDTGPVRGDAEITGWALVRNQAPDCVLVLDQAGTVVGGGVAGLTRRDLAQQLRIDEMNAGFSAVATPGSTAPSVVVRSGGELYRVAAVARKG
ncbi:hypothetical protein GCM10010452_56080 [Crossiella cryophila]